MCPSTTKMESTPLDQMMPICHVSFFYSFLLDDHVSAIRVLQNSLHTLLKNFPFLAGNVGKSSHHGRPSHVFQVPTSNEDSFEDLHVLKVAYHEDIYIQKQTHSPADQVQYDALFDERYLPLPFSMATSDLCPIIRWQANVMQDGIVLVVSFHHSAFDAAGIHIIQHALAKLCRDPNASTKALSLKSNHSIGRKALHSCGSRHTCGKLNITAPTHAFKTANLFPANSLVNRRFSLDADKVNKLKAVCQALNQHRNTSPQSEMGKVLSSNDVVSAFLWMVLTKSRYGPTMQTRRLTHDFPVESSLGLMTEARRIMSPPLPITYVGNASVQSFTTFPTQSFLNPFPQGSGDSPLDSAISKQIDIALLFKLAVQVASSRTSVDDAYVKDMIAQKMDNPDQHSGFQQTDILSTSLRQMKIYGLDFGPLLGRVVEFENPENRLEGSVCVLPARFNSRNAPWEIRMTLKPETMAQVQRDKSFQWALDNCEAKL